jgi:thiol-disulfide isomerase/thioredoxin
MLMLGGEMRRRSVLGTLLGAATLTSWTRLAGAAPAARGELVAWPAFTLLDGSSWSVEQARDRALVVVFWRLDCPYCERHNAHLAKLHRATVGKPLAILGVVSGETDPQAVRRHMAKRGWQFPVTLDSSPLRDALSARRIVPLTVTVDRQGRLRDVIPGEMFEEDVLDLAKLAG